MTFKEVVEAFNVKASMEGLGFRLEYKDEIIMRDNYVSARLILANANGLLYNHGIYLTDKAFEDMDAFFKHNGITLRHNNTGQTFWEEKNDIGTNSKDCNCRIADRHSDLSRLQE